MSDHPPTLLFDGVCNLCNATVQWIIRRDKAGEIHFASLQSDFGQALGEAHGLQPGKLDSIIFYEQGQVYTKSNAALRIGRKLGGGYRLLAGVGRLLPRFVRDGVYDFVARNRYRWFGRRDECMLPRPEWRSRFLDQ